MNKGSDPKVLIWITVAALAIGLGLLATPPEFARPTGAMQRALPRLPGPAPNFRTLLFMLGVGSIVCEEEVVALRLDGDVNEHVDRHVHSTGRAR